MADSNQVKDFIVAVVANNPSGVVTQLRKIGVGIQSNSSLAEIANAAFVEYLKNPDQLLQALRNVKYNAGANNFTTNQDFVRKLRSSFAVMNNVKNQTDGTISVTDTSESWIQQGVDFLTGKTTTTTTTNDTANQTSNGKTIVVVVSIIAVIVIGYLIIK